MEGLSHFEQSSVVVPIKTTVAERKAILGTIESELAATKADVSLIKVWCFLIALLCFVS